MMEISTSFDTLSQTSSPNRVYAQQMSRNGNGSVVTGSAVPYRSSNRPRREDELESLRSTLRSLRSYQEVTAAAGNTSTLESRSTLRGAHPSAAVTATVGGRRSFSNVSRGHAAVAPPSVASSSAPPPPVPVDVIAAVHEVMGARSQSGYAGLNSTVSGSRLTSRRGSACSSGGGGTLRRAPAVPSSVGRQRKNTYGSNSRLSSAG